MSHPAVSVIVSCYNLGAYLDEAIGSVLAQTFADFEILIVDDGSDDPETKEVLAACDRRNIRVLRTTHLGLPAARNAGLRNARGRFVCMLDADDRLATTHLERSVHALEANPELAFVSHWFEAFGDERWTWTPDSCDFPTLLEQNTVNGAALVRRTVLEDVGGYDESMVDGCEDWDLWITLVERGYRGAILPEVLFHYRRRPGSMSRLMQQGTRSEELYEQIIRKHQATFAAHLGTLLARREAELGAKLLYLEDVRLHLVEQALPELRWRQDNERAETRRIQRRQAAEEVSELRSALGQAQDALARTATEVNRWHAEANRSRREAAELRASWSWRLTAPIRAAVATARRLSGHRR